MKFDITREPLRRIKTDVIVVPVTKGLKGSAFAAADRESRGRLLAIVKEDRFEAGEDDLLFIHPMPGCQSPRMLLVGLGKKDRIDGPALRRAAAVGAREITRRKLRTMALALPLEDGPDHGALVRAAVEGARLGSYVFSRYIGSPKDKSKETKSVVLATPTHLKADLSSLKPDILRGIASAEAVILARDLINEPANELGPDLFSERASALGRECGFGVKVMKKADLEKEGMRLLLAVGQGSSREPRFLHLATKPGSKIAKPRRIALVGKGITFDAGGLSIKTSSGMQNMKTDMAGAGVVLAAVAAASRLGIGHEIHGLIPLADNIPSGTSIRPGDIIRSRGGKYVEIMDTDAEGRLILADALSYAADLKPDLLIDLATLTGACVVALGPYTAGLFSTDDRLAESILQAGKETGEPFWRLPLLQELRKELQSSVADLKNIGSRWGGAITAALFLKEFAGKNPWAHLDIAGPASLEKPLGQHPKGATGFGVLTLLRLLETL